MNKTKINWGYGENFYTWNPVSGCNRGCSYCYARKIHERFNKTPFSKITAHPKKLKEPSEVKTPSTVFVGSMSDFEYWTADQKIEIIKICGENPQHTFMFLTKNPGAYFEWRFHENCVIGVTLTCNQDFASQDYMIKNFLAHHRRGFISIEPILGEFKLPLIQYGVERGIEKVIVGAQTGPGAIIPKPEWIQSVIDNIPKEKIFWKESMGKYLPDSIWKETLREVVGV